MRQRLYRGLFGGLAGLTLLAASPGNQDKAVQQHEPAHQVEPSVSPAPIVEPASADETQEPCSKGDEKRSSDLCAQWKAADAAADAADAAWLFGWIGSVVGSLTLLAAGLAAKFARDAAVHTEAGAVEARRAAVAAEAELQSYTANERGVLRIISGSARAADNQPHLLRFNVQVKNSGRANVVVRHIELSPLAGPMWPETYQYQAWSSDFVASDAEEWLASVNIPMPSDFPIWVAGYVEYSTLSELRFQTYFGFRVGEVPRGSSLTTGRTHAVTRHRLADLPNDT